LKGAYSPEAALARLLAGSGLVVRQTGPNVFVVRAPALLRADPQAQLRLASDGQAAPAERLVAEADAPIAAGPVQGPGEGLAEVGTKGDFADASAVPTAVVERVDVLLDGASALYVAAVLDCYLALAAGRPVRAARQCRAEAAR